MKEMKVGSAQGCFFRVKTVNTLSKVHGQIFSVEVNWTSKLLYLLVNIGLKNPGTQSDLVEKWVEYEDVGIVFLYYNDCVICVLFQEILERNIDNMLIPFGQYMEPLPIVVALRVLIQVYCLRNKMMHDVMILSKELFVIFINEEENFYSMALNKSCGVYENRGYTTWFDMKLSVPKTRRVLMMHNFLPLLFDSGGTILKYHTVVEKFVYHLVCNVFMCMIYREEGRGLKVRIWVKPRLAVVLILSSQIPGVIASCLGPMHVQSASHGANSAVTWLVIVSVLCLLLRHAYLYPPEAIQSKPLTPQDWGIRTPPHHMPKLIQDKQENTKQPQNSPIHPPKQSTNHNKSWTKWRSHSNSMNSTRIQETKVYLTPKTATNREEQVDDKNINFRIQQDTKIVHYKQ
ncbi:hypothetical protein FXO37_20468 [Capsicum annuum]|nr:hypothetical protein FXO37_20468 [Capsicum annuum]